MTVVRGLMSEEPQSRITEIVLVAARALSI